MVFIANPMYPRHLVQHETSGLWCPGTQEKHCFCDEDFFCVVCGAYTMYDMHTNHYAGDVPWCHLNNIALLLPISFSVCLIFSKPKPQNIPKQTNIATTFLTFYLFLFLIFSVSFFICLRDHAITNHKKVSRVAQKTWGGPTKMACSCSTNTLELVAYKEYQSIHRALVQNPGILVNTQLKPWT